MVCGCITRPYRHRADRSRLHGQKRPLPADERHKTRIHRGGDEWVTRRLPKRRAAPGRLVFLDETSVKTNPARLRGTLRRKANRCRARLRSRPGTRKQSSQGSTADGVSAPRVPNRCMNAEALATHIHAQRAPALTPRTVVMLDTLSVHTTAEAAEALRENGGWLLFLPPCAPDPTPIEMAFAKLKAHPRRIAARPFDHPIAAIADIRDLFTPHECPNYLSAAAHAPT